VETIPPARCCPGPKQRPLGPLRECDPDGDPAAEGSVVGHGPDQMRNISYKLIQLDSLREIATVG
jgi:hypothetical protein